MRESNRYILIFIFIICVSCAGILSILSHLLAPRQEQSRELYLSTQLLIAADLIQRDQKHSQAELLKIYNDRVEMRLTNNKGDLITFEQVGIDPKTYLRENEKKGYAKLPYKLVYIIKEPNSDQPTGYVLPVNGYGLWDAIYGYISVTSDADTVIGAVWYEQGETPGLGGEIGTAKWQSQFPGKLIFQESPGGQTDFKTARLGIRVVKTTVEQELGDKPAAKSAVDGISGATKTGEGVTDAYKTSLEPYRAFLIRAQEQKTP